MRALTTPVGYRTSFWRGAAGLASGALAAWILSALVLWIDARISVWVNQSHPIITPEGVAYFTLYLGLFYIPVIVAASAVIWGVLHRFKRASWPIAAGLGGVAVSIACVSSGLSDRMLIELPLVGAFCGWLIWRISYCRAS